ncbi:hypothetical protein P2M42_10475 [Mannheimia haemolytica]|nr:hypothetical protein [Mannheimia haemolytica]
MKKWLMLITLIFGITACFSSLEFDESKQEKINSFLIVGNKLYVVGELHDYEFEHQQVAELNNFLKSLIANKIKSVEANFEVKESKKVEGSYRIILDGKSLTESERSTVMNTFHFNSAQNPSITYQAEGNLVKLANREELLQKFRFKQALEANVRYYKMKSGLQNTAEGALSIVMLPVAVVAVLPFYMFWVGACATYGC